MLFSSLVLIWMYLCTESTICISVADECESFYEYSNKKLISWMHYQQLSITGTLFFPKGNSERMIAHHISIISSKVRIKRSWIIKNRLEETSTCHLISFPLLCLSSVNSTNVFLHWCFFDLSVENPQSPEFICSSRAPLPLPFLLVSPNV